MVLPDDAFQKKALEAVNGVFNLHKDVSLPRVKAAAIRLCTELNLENLAKSVERSKASSLRMFFSAKTHKVDKPLRVIITEQGTWQKAVARFLQGKLEMLYVDDPFLIRGSEEVATFLQNNHDVPYRAFSVDIKDLYYSLPHEQLLQCVEEAIDGFGTVRFQNSAGVTARGFIELLSFYLKSTYVRWSDNTYLQKKGVCIGSCVAPVLSDLFLAAMNRRLEPLQHSLDIVKIFRYVDDYLVVLDGRVQYEPSVRAVLNAFNHSLEPLCVTHEPMDNNMIKFLDLKLHFLASSTCWQYEPRAGKPLLPYSSGHSKVVKRGVAKLCFLNSLKKSCAHKMNESLTMQVGRLERAGFPEHILTAVAHDVLKESRKGLRERDCVHEQQKQPYAVIPYKHGLSHRLKKIGATNNVNVVFSAPLKLGYLCKKSYCKDKKPPCEVKHRNRFVDCTTCVVYVIPLDCKKIYIGQTGRCINDRLREHANCVKNANSGNLAIHCRDCKCTPLFDQCYLIARNRNQTTREIIEAKEIARAGDCCVSTPSLALTEKEMYFLGQDDGLS